MKTRKRSRTVLFCERLEARCVLSSLAGGDDFHAVIAAGDPKGSPTDSPALRVDPNTTSSPFAGVGSLRITASNGIYICTATPIDPTHVLTAGHCVDIDDNGVPDVSAITFNSNYSGDLTAQIPAIGWATHPDFTGFNHPSINDDLAVVALSAPVPGPTYHLADSDMLAGQTHIYLVGYGRSGDGVRGYTTNASFTVKRDGENMVDAFYLDDEGSGAKEVFRFDFDGPRPNTNAMGGRTLGNSKETTLGGGDSGGPSFVLTPGADPSLASSYLLAGVDTFTQGAAPKFGSLGGGINVFPYRTWILGANPTSIPTGSGASSSRGSAQNSAILGEMVSSEHFACTTASPDLGASSTGEPLSSSHNVGVSQSDGGNLVANTRPRFAAADSAAPQYTARASRNPVLFAKGSQATTPDDRTAIEQWDSDSVDVVLAAWADGSSAPL